MGILDNIKNMQSLPEHKWTLKKLLKVEKKLLKPNENSILKLLMKKDNKESSEITYIRNNFKKLSIEGLNYNKSRNKVNEK